MSLKIECYQFYCNRASILVEVQKFTYKTVLVSTFLTNVKTGFVVLVGIIHSPCLKHEKNSFYLH